MTENVFEKTQTKLIISRDSIYPICAFCQHLDEGEMFWQFLMIFVATKFIHSFDISSNSR